MKSQGIYGFDVSDAAAELIATAGFDRVNGARELRRAIKRLVETPLAAMLLQNELRAGHVIEIDVAAGKLTFTLHAGETR
jgi:ATP-dependent Clp protease ATP-binding subunit ClpB